MGRVSNHTGDDDMLVVPHSVLGLARCFISWIWRPSIQLPILGSYSMITATVSQWRTRNIKVQPLSFQITRCCCSWKGDPATPKPSPGAEDHWPHPCWLMAPPTQPSPLFWCSKYTAGGCRGPRLGAAQCRAELESCKGQKCRIWVCHVSSPTVIQPPSYSLHHNAHWHKTNREMVANLLEKCQRLNFTNSSMCCQLYQSTSQIYHLQRYSVKVYCTAKDFLGLLVPVWPALYPCPALCLLSSKTVEENTPRNGFPSGEP